MEDFQLTCEGEEPDLVNSKDNNEGKLSKFGDSFNYLNPSSSALRKWVQSLQCLLDDFEGANLVKQFLKQEGHDTSSWSFYFACRGIKMTDPTDKEKLHKFIHVIYYKRVRKIQAISPETKQEIKQKLSSNTEVDANIFNNAQKEVEQYMINVTYPNFLGSDIYLEYLGSIQNEQTLERECHGTPEPSELPTVHEDIEPSFNKAQNYKESLLCGRRWSSNKVKPESQVASELEHTQKAKYTVFINKDDGLNSVKSIPPTKLRVPEFATMTTKDPVKFHSILVKRLQKLEEENITKEKFNERYQNIEVISLSRFFPSEPEEDNAQDILAAHISRVFKDTSLASTQSPICISPPVMKLTGKDPIPVTPPSQSNHIQDMLNGSSQKVGQSFTYAVPLEMRYNRQNLSARSSDSGTFTDYTSEDNFQFFQRSIDYTSSAEERKLLQQNKDDHLKRYRVKNQTDSSFCVDYGNCVVYKSFPIESSWYSKIKNRSKNSTFPHFMDGTSSTEGSSDMTIVGYSYGENAIPYKFRLPGKNITLKQFKSHLSRKGNWRYYFKQDSDDIDTEGVPEEVSDDAAVLPLWNGKVFCIIKPMEENTG